MNIYTCKICSKNFNSRFALQGHSKVHKENYKKPTSGGVSSKLRREASIIKYNNKPKNCKHCNNPLSYDDAKTKIFCNRSCAASYNNLGITRNPKKPKPPKAPRKKLSESERKRLRCEAVMRYRARKYAQTPTNADRKLIREIYINCPPGYEVDHIIPISKGGLHHQDNLQYLTAEENRKKSNKII